MPFIVSCRKEYARYIPGRCLLLDSTVMLTPKINSGMHTNPYDSHLRQGLTKPIIHRLCLSFLYIDSLLQERQQTLAAHKDSPPFIAYSNYLLWQRSNFLPTKGKFFQCLQVWSHLCLSWILQTTNRPLDSHREKGYRKIDQKYFEKTDFTLGTFPIHALERLLLPHTKDRQSKRLRFGVNRPIYVVDGHLQPWFRGYGVLIPDLIRD